MKIGFLTDTHFSNLRTAFRTDDYLKSVMSKFEQCYRLFRRERCDFVIHGGDVFDRHRISSFPLMLQLRKALCASKVHTYHIWGQHDLIGYSPESAGDSSLAFLDEICDGRMTAIDSFIDLGECIVYASHVYQKPQEVLASIPKSEKYQICVVHALLYNKDGRDGEINVESLPETNANLVLSGDLHCGYPLVESKGTLYYNPGSLARTYREERRPKACVIEFGPLMGEWETQMREFFPKCEKFPFPEKPVEAPKAEELDESDSSYLEAFEKFRGESKDIFERLEKAGREVGISEEVLGYILKKRDA